VLADLPSRASFRALWIVLFSGMTGNIARIVPVSARPVPERVLPFAHNLSACRACLQDFQRSFRITATEVMP
jgi:hypothetical protein